MKLGRKQKLILVITAMPFAVACALVVLEMGGATADWWSGFLQFLLPSAMIALTVPPAFAAKKEE